MIDYTKIDLRMFVPDMIYKAWGDKCIMFLDNRILEGFFWLQEHTGMLCVNSSHLPGGKFPKYNKKYNYSGLRPFDHPDGSLMSQHKFGRALDPKGFEIPEKQIYEYIMDNQEAAYISGIRRVEDFSKTPTWVHIDCAYTGPKWEGKIKSFMP